GCVVADLVQYPCHPVPSGLVGVVQDVLAIDIGPEARAGIIMGIVVLDPQILDPGEFCPAGFPAIIVTRIIIERDFVVTHGDVHPASTDAQLAVAVGVVVGDQHPIPGANADTMVQPDAVPPDNPVAASRGAVNGSLAGHAGVLLNDQIPDG